MSSSQTGHNEMDAPPGQSVLHAQRGLSILEISAVSAVLAIVLTLVALTVSQAERIPRQSIAETVLKNDIRSAFSVIREDVIKAQSFQTSTTPTYGHFRWLDVSTFPAQRNRVTYSWDDGSLFRKHYVDDVLQTTQPVATNLSGYADLSIGITSTPNPNALSSTEKKLSITMTLTTDSGSVSQVQETQTLEVNLRPEQIPPTEYIYYYLHNNPTPPVGNTTSQTDLPLNTTAPTATTLYNYDTDRDSELGIRLVRTSDPLTTATISHQDWLTTSLASPMTINGRATFFLYGARIGLLASNQMKIVAFLRDFDPLLLSDVVISSFAVSWFTTTTSWVLVTVQTDEVNYTVPAGHKLKLTVLYHTDSAAIGMVAYDTTAQNSFIMVPTAP